MLDTLQHIVQQVSEASNLDEALSIIVRRVKEAMAVDVCSVYLTDAADGHYVLMASDGLNPGSIGKVRLARNEGLVGLVAARQELLNLENAPDHPNYRYFPETGEERYHAFLGIPLVHFRRVLGVLVVQQRDTRLFDRDEVAFLVTIAAQLAGALNYAAPGGAITLLQNERSHTVNFIQGIQGAPGIAIGTIVLPSPFASLDSVTDRKARDVGAEETAFRDAVATVQEELRKGGERMATRLPSEARALFDVYAMMLGNDSLVEDTVARIRQGQWAPGALRDTIEEHARAFEDMEDQYLQARAEDVRAIGRRILMRLQSDTREPRRYPKRTILFGEEVSLARIAEIPPGRLAGIVCLRGSSLSHTAIVAKALGVPAVMGLGARPIAHLEGKSIVVDGYQGRVFVDPSSAVIKEFERLSREEAELSANLKGLQNEPAETPDRYRVQLYVNTAMLSDIRPALASGMDGVGLYRTEFPFMVRDSFPGEDEQFHVYREVLEAFAPKPVMMRTLDVGGDKPLPYFSVDEDNPYLGWRGIRVTLDHPEIFVVQLRAMLRANAGLENLRIIFPMISSVDEIREAKGLLERAHRELLEEGVASARPAVGAMIEVPSAVYQASALARQVDFFSIGTNDLTQYLLAVDRNNAQVASLYNSLHPAVLHAVKATVMAAKRNGKRVSVCGEMAGEPAAAILLLGMGVDMLSMSASSVPRVKWVIRTITQKHAQAVLTKALRKHSPHAVRELLNAELEASGLGGLVRAGK